MQKTLDGGTEKGLDCKVTGANCPLKRKQMTVLRLKKKKNFPGRSKDRSLAKIAEVTVTLGKKR